MDVGGRRIGPREAPYRIADPGVSHGGDLQLGYKLVETAGAVGAEGIVLHRGALSTRDYKCILGHAAHVGLAALGAPAGEDDLALLVSMDVPGVRLADVDAGDPALLARAARTGRPLILSFRDATPDVVAVALETFRGEGRGAVALLAPDPRMMEAWRAAFPAYPVGLRIPPAGDGHVAEANLIETPHRLPPTLSRRNRP